MNSEDTIERLPIVDKMDYRLTLQKIIEKCINSQGTTEFGRSVNQLILAIATEFPNMDFATPIKQKRIELINEYYKKIDELKKNYEVYYHPINAGINEDKFKEEYFNELFGYIRDLLAINRGLLFGHTESKGMNYDEVD